MDRLEQIKKRLAAATKGPWEVKTGTNDVVAIVRNDVAPGNLPLPEFLQAASDIHVSITFPAKHADDFPSWHGRENADLIASAPEDIAWLIEQVETLEQLKGPVRKLVQLNREIGGANPDWAREAGRIALELQRLLKPEG